MNPKILARTVGALLLLSIFVGVAHLNKLTSEPFTSALDVDRLLLARQTIESAVQSGFGSALVSLLTTLGFFLLLRQTNSTLAGLAAMLRLADVVGHLFTAYLSLQMLQLIRAPEDSIDWALLRSLYEQRIDVFHLALATLSLGVGLNFYLLARDELVPKLLDYYGVIASLYVTASITAMAITPAIGNYVYPWYTYANGVAYLSLTAWLIVFGVSDRRVRE